jgi:hypothetical protein
MPARARRPKAAKLAGNDRLRHYVQQRLAGTVCDADGHRALGRRRPASHGGQPIKNRTAYPLRSRRSSSALDITREAACCRQMTAKLTDERRTNDQDLTAIADDQARDLLLLV